MISVINAVEWQGTGGIMFLLYKFIVFARKIFEHCDFYMPCFHSKNKGDLFLWNHGFFCGCPKMFPLREQDSFFTSFL